MTLTSLQQHVDTTFRVALERSATRPALAEFHAALKECEERLRQPMRVAIVGLIKAGKSTLMNALLGEALLAMGELEATFNVNWLRFGDEPAILLHFKDGRPPEPKSVAELAAVTVRATEHADYLLSIAYVQVFYPNAILRTLNLIDTPGLQSFHVDDSENTRQFLALHGADLSQATETEARNADAVLYLFSRGIAASDQATVEEFLGPVVGRATPITAIGVLTKVDVYWPDHDDPMEGAERVLASLTRHPRVRHLFYTIKPVMGQLALGAQTLTDDDYQTLVELAAMPLEEFDDLIRFVPDFRDEPIPGAPPPERRRQLLDRLGQYGVWLASDRLRAGVSGRAALTAELLRQSGADEVRTLVQNHFGNRAYLIKLGTSLRLIERAVFQARQRLSEMPADLAIVNETHGAFERIEAQEHAFKELRVLRTCYKGRLGFSASETEQVLMVTGEHGLSCAERLGLPTTTPVDDLMAVARTRVAAWRMRANDVLGSDRATIDAADVVAHSYERLVYHLGEAQRLLAEANRHLTLPV